MDKCIKKLNDNDIGSRIYYWNGFGQCEDKGKIKSFYNKKQIAFVVFKCNGDRNNRKDYTAESVSYSDLSF